MFLALGKDDIIKLYNLIKPQISIPVHGTSRHLREHCEIAENCGVSLSIQPENGSLIKLSGNSPSIIYQIPTKNLLYQMATKLLNLIQVFFLQEEDCYGMVLFQ